MKKSINLNVLLAEYLVRSLYKIGVRDVVISPGSRSTPLVIAFSNNKRIRNHVVFDERSNAYFALGLAKSSGRPVAIVTTSGTAVAELYPAVIEAYHQRIPLIVCSADRPEHLVNTGANQTIDQRELFGVFSRCYIDSAKLKATKKYFNGFNKELSKAVKIQQDNPGPIHINLRFEKPLEKFACTHSVNSEFYNFVKTLKPLTIDNPVKQTSMQNSLPGIIKSSKRILVMVGPGNYTKKEVASIFRTSKYLNALIIADGLSGIRISGKPNKSILTNATAFIRNRSFLNLLDADLIIQFGNAPTSNILLNFFKISQATKILINQFGDIKDPSSTYRYLLKMTPPKFYETLKPDNDTRKLMDADWLQALMDLNDKAQRLKEKIIERSKFPCEPELVKLLLDSVPAKSNLMISNSIVPRDVDYFSNMYDKEIRLFHNRGTSGIEGIISTAAGIQAQSDSRTYLLTGDLAFMHDLNGLWLLKKYQLPITIVLINNNGGSIFEMLPVTKEKVDFERYFKVPTGMNFKNITEAFNGRYIQAKSPKQFKGLITRHNNKSFTVIELKTDSKNSLAVRKKYWHAVIEETQKVIDEYPRK